MLCVEIQKKSVSYTIFRYTFIHNLSVHLTTSLSAHLSVCRLSYSYKHSGQMELLSVRFLVTSEWLLKLRTYIYRNRSWRHIQIGITQIALPIHCLSYSGVVPQQAEVAQGVPGRLRPGIFLTFGTARVVGRQPYASAAFTPGEIPGTHFQRLSRPQGTWFRRGEPRKKSPVTPPGIDPGTVP